MDILTAAGAVRAFEDPILEAMERATDYWDAEQFCDFAEAYGRRGSQAARSALYRLFEERPVPNAPELGAEQIVRLDGIRGLLFVAERYGAAIRRGEQREIYAFALSAEEILGAEVVTTAVAEAALHSRDIRVVSDALTEIRMADERSPPLGATRAERLKAISAQQLLEAVDDRSVDHTLLVGWGRSASENGLRAVAARLTPEEEAAKLCDYLKVFWYRALPEFDPRLIDLLNHQDQDVRRSARNALRQNSHPALRELALSRLDAGRFDAETVGLLIGNYEAGDEYSIEKMLLSASGDGVDLHGLCFNLNKVFEVNRAADCARAMHYVYETTPCSLCRGDSVKRLLDAGAATSALVEECRFDADPDIRGMVAAG